MLSSHEHIRRPTWRSGHCQNFDARSSCLSGSGTKALLEVIIATLRWTKSFKKGDLYCAALPAGTMHIVSRRESGAVGMLLTFLVDMRFNVPVRVNVAR